ncbi:GNAT family N-acetyltransferase [Nakamurella sp. A5-74]|uniref:GNAT family N-acetyltransferase n=1 Tax=Nakamurella sp. A5-74 TaxID=3158264 RepID=A0AAU8DMY4_9ACTN
MTEPAVLLQRYDDQLRTDAETQTAIDVAHLGPLLLATLAGGRGFITYRDLGGAGEIRDLVVRALAHYRDDPAISRVEWKTRGHDHAPGLEDALLENGFRPEATESILIGEVAVLADEVALPTGVTVRRTTAEDEIRAMNAMQAEVFDDQDWTPDAPLPATSGGIEYWVAEVAGQIVSAGRLEPVPGTDFAGLWGGATRPEWRGRGIYRALTAARARSALEQGITLVNVDCTEFSRPILERAGLVKVSTTTPYLWRR